MPELKICVICQKKIPNVTAVRGLKASNCGLTTGVPFNGGHVHQRCYGRYTKEHGGK